jgi:hypothetical protein
MFIRPIKDSHRTATICNNSDTANLRLAISMTLLQSKFKLLNNFEIENDELILEQFEDFMVDLFELAHHDISSLPQLNSTANVVKYIITAVYLGASDLFIRALVTKILLEDNDVQVVVDYHRIIGPYLSMTVDDSDVAKRLTDFCNAQQLKQILPYLYPKLAAKCLDNFSQIDVSWFNPKYSTDDLVEFGKFVNKTLQLHPDLAERIKLATLQLSDPQCPEDVRQGKFKVVLKSGP